MRSPRRNDRHDWTEARIADATKAAADGQGWTFLANLWKCSNANALQWSRANVHESVCNQIGINGFLLRYSRSERKNEDRSKPKMQARQSNGRVYWRSCQHIFARGERQGERCHAETEGGKHACPKCLELELTIKNPRIRDTIKTYI
jgi:hypothetical protein